MNLPNKLTILRMFLVIIFVGIMLFPYNAFGIIINDIYLFNIPIPQTNIYAVAVFAVASFTDYLDGHLARKHNLITTFGKFLDPIADKLLVTSALIILTTSNQIPPLVVIIFICRDIIVDALRMMAAEQGRVVAAGKLGKYKTAFQMVAIILLLLLNVPFELVGIPFAEILMSIALVLSVISGVEYLILGKDIILESK